MKLRKFKDTSLKWKLVIPFLFLAVTGATSLFVVSYKFQDSLIHVNEEKRLRNQYKFFFNDIEFKKNMAMSLAYMAAQNCDVAEAFAQRDRERLIELLKPAYETLHKDFDVQQFHFHTENATSFLRLHALDNLECCGEKMDSFRHTITEAFETCNGCGGIELGTFGFAIRSVVPVFYQGNLVGTLEIGLSVGEPFLKNFKKNYGSDVLLYVEKEPGTCELKVLASTLKNGVLSPELLDRCFSYGEEIIKTGMLDDRNVAIISGPVYDFSSEIMAVVEIIVDRSPTQALLKHYVLIAAAIAFTGLVLSISFIWVISEFFTGRIGKVVHGAEEIAAGSRDVKIEVESSDELGSMALAINQMLTSLVVSRNKLNEYARDLEILVDERTKSLKESEATYRTLVENVPIAVYMIMTDGTIVFLNRTIEQLLGATPKELSGNHHLWDAYIHPLDRDRVIAKREECLRETKDLHINYRMIPKDGEVVYGVDHAVAVFDENNIFVRLDGIIVDVTVQKQLHEEHLQAEELETLSQISSRLAHELRNPLTAIGGLTRLLFRSFEAADSRREKANLIIEQVEKLEKILQMIMSYLGPQSVTLEPLELNSIVSEAVESIKASLGKMDFTVKLFLDESIGEVLLDRGQFEKCLKLLMENAYYRMSQRGEITMSTKRIGEHATITLSYQVPYITDDDMKDFFYPFTVAYPFKSGDYNGDIMDVPICKRIIHNHCGMVTVRKEDVNKLWIDISLPVEK
ncbi:MAG: PAS domain S-box protein [Desulfobulbaceae bacterium]|nr:PAS domain S-box protein [Desulfobulbaceae bacterium]